MDVSSLQQDPPICNRMAVYYQVVNKAARKLRCVHVVTSCPVEARKEVMQELHEIVEAFIGPMSVVVQGGKA